MPRRKTDPPPRQPERLVIELPAEVPTAHECLPHAAMSLGAPAQAPRMVKRLVIEPEGPFWVLYRLDAGGGFVGDTTHPSREDALHQARREFPLEPGADPAAADAS